jgi:hypothetical protein
MSSTGFIDDGNNTFNESVRMSLTSVPHVPVDHGGQSPLTRQR